MAEQFWGPALVFHLGLLATAVLIAVRWARRDLPRARRGRWWSAWLTDAVLFGAVLFPLALGAAFFAPFPPFAAARLLCQGVFGEGVLLAVALTALHFRRGARRRALVPALLFLVLVGFYYEAYHRGPYDLQVRQHRLDLSQGRPDAQTLRLLHLTDIQTHEIGPYQERALRLAQRQNADLIVFTGDFIQPRLDPNSRQAEQDFRALLARIGLRAPLGFYAVQGDVDGDIKALFSGLGVTCLDDESTRVTLPGGRTLALTGLLQTTTRGADPEHFFRVIDAAPPADLRFVIGHSPDFVATLAGQRRVDLALAGHTHGGQIVIPFFGPPVTLSRLPRRYAGGLNDYRDLPLHVSRGIGMERLTAPQVRLFCPPEICVLEIRY